MQVDQWGCPIYTAVSFDSQARVKVAYKAPEPFATSDNGGGYNSQDGQESAEMSLNGMNPIHLGDIIHFVDDYGSTVESKVTDVSFVKDFSGKILLTKVVALCLQK